MDKTSNEMNFKDTEIDHLLRRLKQVPVPRLTSDFDQRVMRKIKHGPEPIDRYGRMLLVLYGLLSALCSALVMRGQGLQWGLIAGMIVLPIASVAAMRRAWPAALTRRFQS